MKTAKFTRNIENFICENCKAKNSGNGYTNHCPACLWSKHVDLNPGDRASNCNGMMEPVGLRKKGGQLSIVHRCSKCGLIKPNKFAKNDDRDVLLKLTTVL